MQSVNTKVAESVIHEHYNVIVKVSSLEKS